jgi:hypothetical protein
MIETNREESIIRPAKIMTVLMNARAKAVRDVKSSPSTAAGNTIEPAIMQAFRDVSPAKYSSTAS